MTLLAGQRLELRITSATASGEGVGPHGGRQVHVPGAFPGERVRARVEAVARQSPRVFAVLEEVLEASPARRPSPCAASDRAGGRCGGCPLITLAEPAQRELKRAALREVHGLEVASLEAPPLELGYRLSAKRVAFGGPGRVRLGSWQRGSQRPAHMDGCVVDHPTLTEAAAALEEALAETRIAAFDARDGTGLLRAVWLKGDGARVLVTLVTATPGPGDEAVLRRVAASLPVHGVAWSVKTGAGASLRGAPATALAGTPELRFDLGEGTLEVGPLAFLQPNPAVAEHMYDALVGTQHGALALDLYAGAGLTTRRLARRFSRVVASEANAEAAARLGIAPEPVNDVLARLIANGERPELIVANPPRAGLGPEVARALGRLGAPALRMLACGPAGLRRDLDALAAAGYALRELRAFDPLPQTPHVELLAVLQRSSSTST
ncbi:MAG: TRAM domain-containing protein [Myxococcota bacterium]